MRLQVGWMGRIGNRALVRSDGTFGGGQKVLGDGLKVGQYWRFPFVAKTGLLSCQFYLA